MFKGSNPCLTLFFHICCRVDKAVCKLISETNIIQEYIENIFEFVSLVA